MVILVLIISGCGFISKPEEKKKGAHEEKKVEVVELSFGAVAEDHGNKKFIPNKSLYLSFSYPEKLNTEKLTITLSQLPDKKSVSSQEEEVQPNWTGFVSTFHIPEEKGKLAPGNYLVQVHRGSDLLAEGNFEIEAEPRSTGILFHTETNYRTETKYSIPTFTAPEIAVSNGKTQITVKMPDHLLFDFDKSNLKSEAKQILEELTRTLTEYKQATVKINGHTDNIGSQQYNRSLSEKRATAVKSYLQKKQELRHIQFSAEGYGDTKPIASNQTEDGRQKNRRVEIIIEPK